MRRERIKEKKQNILAPNCNSGRVASEPPLSCDPAQFNNYYRDAGRSSHVKSRREPVRTSHVQSRRDRAGFSHVRSEPGQINHGRSRNEALRHSRESFSDVRDLDRPNNNQRAHLSNSDRIQISFMQERIKFYENRINQVKNK